MIYKNAKNRVSIIIIIIILLICNQRIESYGYYNIQEEVEKTSGNEIEENKLNARAAVLLDGQSGRILYSKEGNQVMPMASTTKIMTCIIALENGNLDDIYETSSYAASMPKVHLGARTGERFFLKDLLYSLMLESHNDSAVIIAEGVAGSVEGFTHLMNKKAKELGCENTNFVTPNGLDADNHYTTAEELALIMKYCITASEKKEQFLEITQTSSYQFMDADNKRSFSCNNHNAFLTMMNGAISGKTGFTGKAGYCYVGAVEREDKLLIGVVLASGWPPNKTYKWKDMTKLITYGVENFEKKEVATITTPDPIKVIDGQEDSLLLQTNEKTLEALLKADDVVTTKVILPEWIQAPVEEGEHVGEIQVFINNELYDTTPVLAKKEVKKVDYRYCLEKLIQFFLP